MLGKDELKLKKQMDLQVSPFPLASSLPRASGLTVPAPFFQIWIGVLSGFSLSLAIGGVFIYIVRSDLVLPLQRATGLTTGVSPLPSPPVLRDARCVVWHGRSALGGSFLRPLSNHHPRHGPLVPQARPIAHQVADQALAGVLRGPRRTERLVAGQVGPLVAPLLYHPSRGSRGSHLCRWCASFLFSARSFQARSPLISNPPSFCLHSLKRLIHILHRSLETCPSRLPGRRLGSQVDPPLRPVGHHGRHARGLLPLPVDLIAKGQDAHLCPRVIVALVRHWSGTVHQGCGTPRGLPL